MKQIRGYADQRLRKPADPEDSSNRRISLIVEYLAKPDDEDAAAPTTHAKVTRLAAPAHH
jgi:hypothetical protein